MKDLEATLWLERFLCAREGTLVVIAHDIAFLDSIAEESIAIKFKKLEYFEGTPSAWEINRIKESKRVQGQKQALDKKKEHVCSVLCSFIVINGLITSLRSRRVFNRARPLPRKVEMTTSKSRWSLRSIHPDMSQVTNGQVPTEEVGLLLLRL
jgi:hypothetical protein